MAACLVLLQLVTALHFALIPHAFSAGLNGFVHVHESERASAAALPGPAPSTRGAAAWVRGAASCAPDSCPVGFAGAHSLLFAAANSGALLEPTSVAQAAPRAPAPAPRKRVLLSAPKTSPPSSSRSV